MEEISYQDISTFHRYERFWVASEVIYIPQRPLARDEATEMKVILMKYIEEEVPMNEDWYMVGIVVDVLCELMLSLYFVDHVNSCSTNQQGCVDLWS